MPIKAARKRLPTTTLVSAYLSARDYVIACGYGPEIDWQDQCFLDQVTESSFLRETAWVILSAGMRERVIRNRFPAISEAFLSWRSASDISRCRRQCARAALKVFRHPTKIAAIAFAAQTITTMTFEAFRTALRDHGIELLQEFPFIGPVTRYHLAKNLGMDVVKPDRHLVRLAHTAGFEQPDELCRAVAEVTGDRIGTIDVVLWRYATLDPSYLHLFDRPERNHSDRSRTARDGRCAGLDARPCFQLALGY